MRNTVTGSKPDRSILIYKRGADIICREAIQNSFCFPCHSIITGNSVACRKPCYTVWVCKNGINICGCEAICFFIIWPCRIIEFCGASFGDEPFNSLGIYINWGYLSNSNSIGIIIVSKFIFLRSPWVFPLQVEMYRTGRSGIWVNFQ